MRIFITTMLVCYLYSLSAQETGRSTGKLPIDTANILNWPTIPDGPNAIISNNGAYLLYHVWHIPPGDISTMVRSVGIDWELSLADARGATFTNDSRQVVFLTSHDSLCIMTLPDVHREYEANIHSFKLFRRNDKETLIYQRDNPKKELVLHELISGQKWVYANIKTHIVSKDGQNLLLQSLPDSNGDVTLLWVDVATKKQKNIWKGNNASSLCFDEPGKRLAFLVQDSAGYNTLWLYKAGEKQATELLKVGSTDLAGTMKIIAIDKFNKDGDKLFFHLQERSQEHSKHEGTRETTWSYTDPKLQTLQAGEKLGGAPSYLASLDLQHPQHIWLIQQRNESISANSEGMNFVLLTSREGSAGEEYWNKAASCNTILAVVNKQKKIPLSLTNATFSLGQKYVIGNGKTEYWGSDLFVYDIAANTTRNITESIAAARMKEESDIVQTSRGKGLILAGWLPEDTSLLVYDHYDIWQIDPKGKRKPTKLTNGRKRKIQFRLAEDDFCFSGRALQPQQPVILTAFNTKTKQNGFYRLNFATGQEPELLFMGDLFFSKAGANVYFLKAHDRNIYLVRREQTGQAPNIFYTTDFRSFSPVTHMHPEISVNWFTSEQVTFTTETGIETQAILYKPENFHPTKRYPLLIHYYDKMSNELNRYRPPQGWGTGGDLDVAWFASHGYLVLLIDIHYNVNKPGTSVYHAVVSAAKCISKRPYVDKDHIGIQGHSFGGYETNYVITHSNLFAAAVSSAGISDAASSYGSLWPDGNSVQEYFEQRGFRIDRTPWQAPVIYADNSPIFSVAHTNTPVLIVHNKSDRNVYFEQGLTLFTSLRRAGKRAWMLQYDNGGHGQMGEDYKDYIIRTTQFFDHYLKGAPPPEWMIRGIPAAMKGIDAGLTVDKDGKTPGSGLLSK